jgi:acetyl esterase
VALVAAREGLPLAFQLLVYPGTDMTRSTESHRLFGEGFYLSTEFMDLAMGNYLQAGEETDPRASPLFADIPAGVAPAYLCTAGFDPLRDEGEAYAERLRSAGVQIETRRFDGLIHGFVSWLVVGRANRAAVEEVAAALRPALTSVARP